MPEQAIRRAKPALALCLWVLFLLALLLPGLAQAKGLTAENLVSMARISGAAVSPDGEWVVYSLRTTDLQADRGERDLWMVRVDGTGEPRRLTTHPSGEGGVVWAPDGRSLYFLASRTGSSQVWRLPLQGGEAEPITDLAMDVGNLRLAPDGRSMAFTQEVYVDCPDAACTVGRDKEKHDSKRTGLLYERLFVRHWDTWKEHKRSHLFVLPLGKGGRVPEGAQPVDVTRGMDADVPSKPFGGAEEITFTPDGKGLVFAARQAGREEPWSTDFNLYHVPADGSGPPRRLTENPAWDTHPVFSPDGKTLAYLAMERAGFEADRFRVILRAWPEGKEKALTQDWDRSVRDLFFSADSKTLFVTAQDTGEVPLFAIDIATAKVRELFRDGTVRSPALAGQRLVFGRDHLGGPVDLHSINLNGGAHTVLTAANAARLAEIEMGEYEQFSFPGWNEETVHGFVVKPAGYEAGKKYPLAFLIHGGPQGSFSNNFHYRWNPQTYAGAGYVAVMIDFHGSTGYGQAFTDSITGDWGGKPLVDLQKGLAFALEKYPFIDGERACALGASYGGYMINWIAGNWSDRFDCLVNHDGLFDTRDMYYSTEELWFPEWEFGGTPYDNPEGYAKFNPALHVDKWQSPMLVIHGALDYRVVDTQGLATFTALQRRGVPSQLLYYPDENHWVLKPNNSIQWHETVLAWLEKWTTE